MTEFDDLMKAIQSATRKGLFRRRHIFELHGVATSDELDALERKIGIALPGDLRRWLLVLGYGIVDGDLSIQENWFSMIERGQLKGGALFAQDTLGNFYGFDNRGRIHFFSRSEPVFSIIAESFFTFVQELVRRDYKILEWVDSLATHPYDW